MPEWTTYLDGSFRDGPSEELGRTGWGFISDDTEGMIRAAAFGVPPPWIRAIHGAEMWALYAALRCSLPGGFFRSDRKAVVDTFMAGKRQATSAGDEHARLWEMIFATCDSVDPPQLLWMPAHTSAADVGRARLSNGQVLTAKDRSANDAADTLAKRGAETHRVPKDVRRQVKQRDLLAVWAARTLGIVTHAANHAPCPSSGKPLRDSAGLPRAARKKPSRLRRLLKPLLPAPTTVPLTRFTKRLRVPPSPLVVPCSAWSHAATRRLPSSLATTPARRRRS